MTQFPKDTITVRDFVIEWMQDERFKTATDFRALGRVIARWLDVRRPLLEISGGRFVFTTYEHNTAVKIRDFIGGTIHHSKDGVSFIVAGEIVDLTF